jgi:hypothetical protein
MPFPDLIRDLIRGWHDIRGGNVSIVPELAIWQELLLLVLGLLSLVYVFYFKIWVALATGSDLIFAAALALAVASVAVPILFDRASTTLVDRSSLPEALTSADQKVAAIEALPGELIERALAKLGYEADPEEEPLEAPGPGPFQATIRPSVEALVSFVLRTASFFTAGLLLLMALALRSSTSTARALQTLTRRTDALETRLIEALPGPSNDTNRGPTDDERALPDL